jgi:hypothetical protein
MLIAGRKRRDKGDENQDYDCDKNDPFDFDFTLFVGKHIFADAPFVIFYFAALQGREFLFRQSRGDGRLRARPSR